MQQGYNQYNQQPVYGSRLQPGSKDKTTAGLLAIFLGTLGIHKFYLGYTTSGVIMLVVSIVGALLFGLGPAVMAVIALIEGIIYLTKDDMEFDNTYVVGEKQWF
ncbi:MAG: TM2 domain-containing protein [Eubacterium sp.]|nr:TM2 domain-containing protein [Eubacterium sp.]